MVSAISVRLFRLYPSRYIAANVPTSDSGTATLGITVAAGLRKNRKITVTTSAMVSMSSNCTSRTDARMVAVRSVRTEVWMDEGSDVSSCGRSFVMLSTTWMMFAPGRRQRSEEHTFELQSLAYLVCRLLLEKKKKNRLTRPSTENKKNRKK